MKKTILFLFILASFYTSGQTYIGVAIEPSFQVTSIADQPSQTADSLKDLVKADLTLSYGLEFRFNIDRFNAISFRPSYHQFSSRFYQEDLQFLDVFHPALPEIRDLSVGAQKNASIHNRFSYVGLGVEFDRSISDKYKSVGVLFEAHGGLTYHYLLSQDAKVVTEAFAVNQSFINVVDSNLLFQAAQHNVSISMGATGSYAFATNAQVYGGVNIRIPFLSATSNDPKLRQFMPGFRAGLRLSL